MKADVKEFETAWRIRIYRKGTSSQYPIEQYEDHDEIKTLLDNSNLEPDDHDMARFFAVGEKFSLQGQNYRVTKIRLKIYDHTLNDPEYVSNTGTEIQILMEVEPVP